MSVVHSNTPSFPSTATSAVARSAALSGSARAARRALERAVAGRVCRATRLPPPPAPPAAPRTAAAYAVRVPGRLEMNAAMVAGEASRTASTRNRMHLSEAAQPAPNGAFSAAPAANASPEPTVAVSYYRRPLPPQCTALDSPAGRERFQRSFNSGHAEPFLPLISQFTTQSEPAFCGLGTLAMVLNALELDPGRLWKGPWRWFSEELLDCCLPLDMVARDGVSLHEFQCLGQCNGAEVLTFQPPAEGADATETSLEEALTLDAFRGLVQRHCRDARPREHRGFLVLCYSRATLGQTGSGHFSPLAAYDPQTDSALVLDVARFKYAPHWVGVELLYEAMRPVDPATGRPRGLAVVRRRRAPTEHGVMLDSTTVEAVVKEEEEGAVAPAGDAKPLLRRPQTLLLSRLDEQHVVAQALRDALTATRVLLRNAPEGGVDVRPVAAGLVRIWRTHLQRCFEVTPLMVRDPPPGRNLDNRASGDKPPCGCVESRRALVHDVLHRSALMHGERGGADEGEETVVAPIQPVTALVIAAVAELASRPASALDGVAPSIPDDDVLDGVSVSRQLVGCSDIAYAEVLRVADVLEGFLRSAGVK